MPSLFEDTPNKLFLQPSPSDTFSHSFTALAFSITSGVVKDLEEITT